MSRRLCVPFFALSCAVAHAQPTVPPVLIAGFDGSNLEAAGSVSLLSNPGVVVGVVPANFSDVAGDDAEFQSTYQARAFLYLDGSNGSSLWNTDFLGNAFALTTGLDSTNEALVTPRRSLGGDLNGFNFNAYSRLPFRGTTHSFALEPDAARNRIAIVFNSSGFQRLTLSYAARLQEPNDGTISGQWSVRNAAGNLTPVGPAVTIQGTTPATYTLDLNSASAVNNAPAATLVFAVTVIPPAQPASNPLRLLVDNIQIVAAEIAATEVVPTWPSSTPSSLPSGTVGTNYNVQLAAEGSRPITYAVSAGALPPGLTLTSSGLLSGSPTAAGLYAFTITPSNAAGAGAGRAFSISVAAAPDTTSQLSNLSTRGQVGTGSDVMIGGFVLTGPGERRILLRAIGATLAQFGLPSGSLLADPRIRLVSGQTDVASNDNWSSSADAATIAAEAARVGAFALPSPSTDAALIANLAAGAYTAVVEGANSGTGVALLEVYDLSGASGPRLVNIATRLFVGLDAAQAIPGIVVTGTQTRRFVVRAVGPGLAGFGVPGTLANPRLQVVRTTPGQPQTTLAENDNWTTANDIVRLSNVAGAFALTAGSNDAAVVVDLPAGTYTVLVTGVGTPGTGVALVEVYDVTGL